MMARISAEEVANIVGLTADELSKPCDGSIIPSLADCFREWRVIFGSLLSELDLGDVDRENTTEEEKRIAALRKWRVRNGSEATYKILVDALLNRGERSQAESLCKTLAGPDDSIAKSSKNEWQQQHVKDIAIKVGLAAEELSKPCDSSIIPSLADCFSQWRVIFGSQLSELDLDDIDRDKPIEQERRIAALRKWKARKGCEATYEILVGVLLSKGERYQAESLCKILAGHLSDNNGETFDFKEIPNSETPSKPNIPRRWRLQKFHSSKSERIDGEGITIAVLDSGINVNHEIFAESALLINGKCFIEGKSEDYWRTNREAHGTMMAGIIKMYAPKAELYICCVSESKRYEEDAIIKALEHLKESYEDVRDKKKCQVIVMSYGHYIKKKKDDKFKELIDNLARKGVICVAAIGNDGLFVRNFAFPACLKNVISVGSLTEFGYDKSAKHNPPGKPDMYAPGEQVSFPVHLDNRNYRKGDGTSCAAPAIGGIVALLMQLAHKSEVEISDVQLIKKIYSHMKTEILPMPGGEKKMVLDPNHFFDIYGTPDNFKDFFLQSLIKV